MSNNVYAVSEVVGSSQNSIEDAVSSAISTASKSLKNIEWFEVIETRGHVRDGAVAHYQVVVKLGFRYED